MDLQNNMLSPLNALAEKNDSEKGSALIGHKGVTLSYFLDSLGVNYDALLEGVAYAANVKSFGAKGDGVTNDLAAFIACRDYCLANNKMMYAPDESFYMSGDLDLWGVNRVLFNGAILFPNTTDKIIVGGNTVSAPSINIDIYATNGTIKVHGMNRGRVKFNYANTLHLYASDDVPNRHTVSYSVFEWVNVDTLHLECQDTQGGVPWINENEFPSGRVRNNVLFDGTYPMNNNKFLAIVLESVVVDIQIGNSNQFHNVRLEGNCTFNFGSTTFNNIFWVTWANFSFVGFVGRESGHWTINDNGANNDIVPVQHTYTDGRTIFELSADSANYNWLSFEKVGIKLKNKKTYTSFFDTGLVPLDHPIWFVIESDATLFNYYVEVFDEDGNRIYTNMNVVEAGMSWNDSFAYYDTGGVNASGMEISIKKVAGVGFFRLWGRTGGNTLDQLISYWRLRTIQKKRGARELQLLPYQGGLNSFHGVAVPTYGAFSVGDIVENSAPSVGNPTGWKCVQSGVFSNASSTGGSTTGNVGSLRAVVSGLSDTSGFNVGDYVTASAGFSAGDLKVISIDSPSQLTLSRTSDSVQANVTISAVNPVFGAMASLV